MLAGKYKEAFDKLQSVQTEVGGNLKLSQLLAECTGTVKLKKALYKYNPPN